MTIAANRERTGLSRRSFMKWSGVAGGSAALVATAAHLGMPGTSAQADSDGITDADKTVWSACNGESVVSVALSAFRSRTVPSSASSLTTPAPTSSAASRFAPASVAVRSVTVFTTPIASRSE